MAAKNNLLLMKYYYLKISSKNEKSLQKFLIFFLKHLQTKTNNVQKLSYFRNKKKKITVLKSPHVNKIAQEHFETRTFTRKILLKATSLGKSFIFIKKILSFLFQDILIKTELISDFTLDNKDQALKVYTNNYNFFIRTRSAKNAKRKEKTNTKFSSKAKLFNFLALVNTFGECVTFNPLKSEKSLSSSGVEQRTENPCVDSSNLSSDKIKLLMKNYLWNMFANIKNGQLSKRNSIFQKRKKICEEFLKILWTEGFILGYKINKNDVNQIKIFLKYNKNQPAIHSIKFLSKPSRRIYYSAKQIWKLNSAKSFIIFSTNKGLKSILECKKLHIGGEPFISIN